MDFMESHGPSANRCAAYGMWVTSRKSEKPQEVDEDF
jgi:hypothetical protein